MPTAATPRFTLTQTDRRVRRSRFADDVRAGLTARQKHLHCCYFYDAAGSLLFEQISELPEYYLTRTERALLRKAAPELAGMLPDTRELVELGSGSASKTRLLLEAFLATADAGRSGLTFVPVDISPTILEESAQALLRSYPGLRVQGLVGEYESGLEWLRDHADRRPPRLILWLGSSIGNLTRREAAAFLRRVAAGMSAADRLLVGFDLRKDTEILERAYNDAAGVTARFNLNLLARINRELGGEFDLERFRHRAWFNAEEGRVEMHLESRSGQSVRIESLDLEVAFAAGETIHTENSYKYTPEEIAALANAAGLRPAHRWRDSAFPFSLDLFSRGA